MADTLKQKNMISFVGTDGSPQTRPAVGRTVVYTAYDEGYFTIPEGDNGTEYDIPLPEGLDVITYLEVLHAGPSDDVSITYELNFSNDVELGPGGGFTHRSPSTEDAPLYGCAIFADDTPGADIRVEYRVFGVAVAP